jgi:tRNA threonylcarbamoyladenosine biosynthesis protein TsaB
MNVLGFDTSTAATSVCLLRSDSEAFEIEPPVERLAQPPGHARELMPGIDRVMREAGLGFGDLDAIAVGIGPGGFTGLRIGLATAHGIAQSAGIPLHPVLSLAALDAGIREEAAVPREGAIRPPHTGDTLPLIDAKRNEVYGLDRAGQPFVGPLSYAIEKAREGALAAGDGSIRFRQALESAGIRVAPGNARMHVVRSLYICRLATTVPPAPPESVVPCYLRAPDAKPPSPSAG